jgi:hypothetical protein
VTHRRARKAPAKAAPAPLALRRFLPAGAAGVARAVIVGLDPDGRILVAAENAPDRVRPCDRLEAADLLRTPYRPGDRVLALLPADGGLGCVLGRVGLPEPGEVAGPEGPTETVVRARGRLTLQCGSASITLSEDGKVLIKGVDVVSRATATNRIKGGSVRIN